MNELSILQQYPIERYNLLGNTDVMVEIPDIKSPVVQAVKIDPNPDRGDVYLQQKGWVDKNNIAHPDKYAITKNGLKKLADGAGIKMISSEHVIPTTCQKCVAVNQGAGKVIQCGNCRNQDVAYRVTISVPQLTGEILTVEDTHEIIVDNVTPSMTEKQKAEFMKHMPQICEAKALNGAIRTALHIKGTYTVEELSKPFVVAYLVPNLNHTDVKEAAIKNMFQSSANLFGNSPSIQQIESKVPEAASIEASDGENFDNYVDGTYTQDVPVQQQQTQDRATLPNVPEQRDDWYCDKCGEHISEKVWNYSVNRFERPLCYKCQKIVKGGNR